MAAVWYGSWPQYGMVHGRSMVWYGSWPQYGMVWYGSWPQYAMLHIRRMQQHACATKCASSPSVAHVMRCTRVVGRSIGCCANSTIRVHFNTWAPSQTRAPSPVQAQRQRHHSKQPPTIAAGGDAAAALSTAAKAAAAAASVQPAAAPGPSRHLAGAVLAGEEAEEVEEDDSFQVPNEEMIRCVQMSWQIIHIWW